MQICEQVGMSLVVGAFWRNLLFLSLLYCNDRVKQLLEVRLVKLCW